MAEPAPKIIPRPSRPSFLAAPQEDELKIDLKNPILAGALAWLIPGAGHFYQGRNAKGMLFCICILGTYLFGVALGEGKVVHTGGDAHVAGRGFARVVQTWPIIPQSCVGITVFPAYVQYWRSTQRKEPLWGGFMAPPRSQEELSHWYERLNVRYDVGALYTIVAGLLNVLAIYDAACGPVIIEEEKKDDKDDDPKKKEAK